MTFWPALVLLLLGILSRLGAVFLGWPMHLNALTAIALTSAVLLPRHAWAGAVSLAALWLSDLVLNAHYGVAMADAGMLIRYVCLAAVAFGGWRLQQSGYRGRFWPLVAASLLASTLFYVVTNTACWALAAEYPAGSGGWWMALTSGLPGYPPAWTFYRNALAGDLAFTMLFYACVRLGERKAERSLVASPAH